MYETVDHDIKLRQNNELAEKLLPFMEELIKDEEPTEQLQLVIDSMLILIWTLLRFGSHPVDLLVLLTRMVQSVKLENPEEDTNDGN